MINNVVTSINGGYRALVSAVILNAVRSYAVCLVSENKNDFNTQDRKGKISREKSNCERFFKSDTYIMYAEFLDLRISGREMMRLIQRDPYKFAERLRDKEKRAWRDNV